MCYTRGVPAAVRAVLFDLDGTLIDSEKHTDGAIAIAGRAQGIEALALPPELTRGRTWGDIAASIRERTGAIIDPQALNAVWNELVLDVSPLPGAVEAVLEAASCGLRLAIVSSSPRAVIDRFAEKLGIASAIAPVARIGAEAVVKTKPDPEGYLRAAAGLEAAPSACVVFEDSQAGLRAARAAGMRSVFVTCCAANLEENRALATAACTDYTTLPEKFWSQLAEGTVDLQDRYWT